MGLGVRDTGLPNYMLNSTWQQLKKSACFVDAGVTPIAFVKGCSSVILGLFRECNLLPHTGGAESRSDKTQAYRVVR